MSPDPIAPALAGVRRDWLERVLDTVRQLGSSEDLTDALTRIADAVSDVLEFDAAAVNVVIGDEVVCVAMGGAMAAEVDGLIGAASPLHVWMDLVEQCESFGPVSFYSHDRDQGIFDTIVSVSVDRPVAPFPDAWHPEDLLFLPLQGIDGGLVGMLSVDHPRSGRFPDEEQRTVLELFAVQAAAVIEEANRRARLGDRQLLYRTLFAETPAPTLIVDDALVVRSANHAADRLLDAAGAALVGASFVHLVEPIDRVPVRQLAERVLAGTVDGASIEHRVRRADGALTWMRTGIGRITSTLSGVRLVVNLEEVTQARRTIEELQYLSDHDARTGLANREATYDLLVDALEGCGPDQIVAVLSCGPDDFGAVARRHGHVVADELLVRIARRLEGALAPGDRLCQPSDDAFTIIAGLDRDDPDALAGLVDRVRAVMRLRFELRTGAHDLTLSVGSVVAVDLDGEPASLLEAAAAALASARAAAPGSWRLGEVEAEPD